MSSLEDWLEWFETYWNLPFVYLDIGLRWLFADWLGNLYSEIELFFTDNYYKLFVQPIIDEDDAFCIDEDGLHFKGDEWQSAGRCNKRKCISHDVIKETGCPEVCERNGCQYNKESLSKPYPECCPSLECPPDIVPPIRRDPPVTWYRDESYNHV